LKSAGLHAQVADGTERPDIADAVTVLTLGGATA
jgi:hypothetical protein